ncbi:MAG: peptidyl-prolyl cis-trans isomerase A [Actinobacteria bacterium]|nr:peptidyl-prolyl cis-trans isomerase A [Actinomycetota bacterium]
MNQPLFGILLAILLLFTPIQATANSTEPPPTVQIVTNYGDIILRLYPKEAPKTTANFLRYVNDGFYDHSIFHRVIDGFLIQAGGFNADMSPKKTLKPILNESRNTLKNERGMVGMAQAAAAPHSAESQFYINVVDNFFLDKPIQNGYGFTVFAKVIHGMKTVDKIKRVQTRNLRVYSPTYKRKIFLHHVPEKTVLIESAKQLSQN